jgi:hypothetical protein
MVRLDDQLCVGLGSVFHLTIARPFLPTAAGNWKEPPKPAAADRSDQSVHGQERQKRYPMDPNAVIAAAFRDAGARRKLHLHIE